MNVLSMAAYNGRFPTLWITILILYACLTGPAADATSSVCSTCEGQDGATITCNATANLCIGYCADNKSNCAASLPADIWIGCEYIGSITSCLVGNLIGAVCYGIQGGNTSLINNVCTVSCPVGLRPCNSGDKGGGICTDLTTPSNCGTCGHSCISGKCSHKNCTLSILGGPCLYDTDCNGSSLVCNVTGVNGTCVGSLGANCTVPSNCFSQICNRTCAVLDVGSHCKYNVSCQSSFCQHNGTCALSGAGVPCPGNASCLSGRCIPSIGSALGVCAPAQLHSLCRNSSDCSVGLSCFGGTCLVSLGANCNASSDSDCSPAQYAIVPRARHLEVL